MFLPFVHNKANVWITLKIDELMLLHDVINSYDVGIASLSGFNVVLHSIMHVIFLTVMQRGFVAFGLVDVDEFFMSLLFKTN